MKPRDPEMTRRARDLDREAFRALLERLLPRVRGLLFRLGAPSDELDDLVQEVFLTVIRRLDSFRSESSISTWVLGIAVNVLRTWRRRRTEEVRNMDERASVDAEPPSALAALEAGERLRGALSRLSPPLREAFVLRHVEELRAVEVASVLGVPEGTVRRRAHEAREKLRGWLEAPAERRERMAGESS